jgi:hypothetical protein
MMKQLVITASFLALLLTGTAAWSQSGSAAALGWRVDTGLDAAAFISEPYAAPETTAVYSPGLFGIGFGTKGYIGMLYGDTMAAPYLRGEIGALYLDLGGVLPLGSLFSFPKASVGLSYSYGL